MKKFFRKLAGYIVTIYANRIYRKAVKEADKYHEVHRERFYVASSIEDVRELVIYNRYKFRQIKNRLFIPKFYISNLKDGAWYYTGDRLEQGCLTPEEKEIRRLAFVRHVLHRAKLI
jgi:hypothetical protein